MKVLFLSDVITPPLTGIGRYAYELSQRLKSHKDVENIQFFHNYQLIQNPKLLLETGQVFNKFKKNAPLRSILRPLYQKFRQSILTSKSKHLTDYILHSPNYYLFPFHGSKIVTIHDLSHIRFPQFHPKDRIQYLTKELEKSLKRANHIITVSEFSKREILEYFKLPEEKVSVTPEAAGDQFKPRDEVETQNVLNKYNLNFNQYLLSVSTFEPRKNLSRLIDAYASLPESLKKQYPLILVGASGWENKQIHLKIKKLISKENIKCLHYVSDLDLPFLYSGARAFAYPSLYEGFGLQVLEAMSSGIPVLTSNSSSLVEISGGAACLIDPSRKRSIAEGLELTLTDDKWRLEARTKGLNNSKQYTWDKCVETTLDAYRKSS